MFKHTRLITIRAGMDDQTRARLIASFDGLVAGLPDVSYARTRPSLGGSVNGGDIVCHLQFPDEAAYRACTQAKHWTAIEEFCSSHQIARCDSVAYRQEANGIREPRLADGVHRILLLSVRPSATLERLRRFEAEMRTMPAYLPAIRNWGFSPVLESRGVRRWTHVWEQEFADAQGLFGPYMMHPIHFAHIDRWFDPQSHDWIVDPELCSTYCQFHESALALPLDNSPG